MDASKNVPASHQNVQHVKKIPKNVPLSHRNVTIDSKITSYLDKAQQDKQLWGTFYGTLERFFGTPDVGLSDSKVPFTQ